MLPPRETSCIQAGPAHLQALYIYHVVIGRCELIRLFGCKLSQNVFRTLATVFDALYCVLWAEGVG